MVSRQGIGLNVVALVVACAQLWLVRIETDAFYSMQVICCLYEMHAILQESFEYKLDLLVI